MQNVTENPNNFIIKNYNKYGENFLNSHYVSIEDIQQNAIYIIRDILNKKIDLSKYGRFILEPVVIANLEIVFVNKARYYEYLCESLEYTRVFKYKENISETQYNIELKARNNYKTYIQIAQTLNNIKYSQNITEFDILANRLKAENLIYNLK